MLNNELALILDTETTSKYPNEAKIVEIGAVCATIEDGKQVNRILMSTRCDPKIQIPNSCTEIHGITNDTVKFCPMPGIAMMTLCSVIKTLQEDYTVFVVGHNFDYYDKAVMENASEEYMEMNLPTVDTFKLARRLWPEGKHTLGDIYEEQMGIPLAGAHSAVVDCLAVAALLPAFFSVSEAVSLQELHTQLKEARVYPVIPFGKHKGKSPDEVPSGYGKWCLNNFSDMSPDVRATMEYISKNGQR